MNNIKNKIKQLSKELSSLPPGRLHLKHGKNYTAFVRYDGPGKEKNINRDKNQIYALARKKYIELLIPDLKSGTRNKSDRLLRDFEDSGLELLKITLSKDQYSWMHSNYKRNPTRPGDLKYISRGGTHTRSKSEKAIASLYDSLGIPYRYESALTMDVSALISDIEKESRSFRQGKPLFNYNGFTCVWNVPSSLAWMNNPGSIWRNFDDRTGTITVFPDFSIIAFDLQILIHEHEGVASNPLYRSNASERIFVMRESGAVKSENLLTTFERDLLDEQTFRKIAENRILPRI